MRRIFAFLAAIAALAALAVESASSQQPSGRGGGRGSATAISAGESCPPGMTEIRPRSCMAPDTPAPSIVDYRPHATLIAPVHMVKTAR